jgi:hypothetical protein
MSTSNRIAFAGSGGTLAGKLEPGGGPGRNGDRTP